MESESEREARENREFWELLTPESTEKLLNEIARKSITFFEPLNVSIPRKTRTKRTPETPE